MTVLITLTDSIIAPDGEEYRAVWGECIGRYERVIVGNCVLPNRYIMSIIECPRPQKDTTPFTETKDGKLYHDKQLSDFPHIYYAD